MTGLYSSRTLDFSQYTNQSDKSMTTFTRLIAIFSSVIISSFTYAQEAEQPNRVLITNVNVWDGTSDSLTMNSNVLVENNLIAAAGPAITLPEGTEVIDGGGRTLMPGLIDMHSHFCVRDGLTYFRDGYDALTVGAYVHMGMQEYLDQGFTTARDAGCNILGIAKAVNNGILTGPRLFPSGGFLSQTGGHADLGYFSDTIKDTDSLERAEMGYIVDGVPEVIKAARQNLRRGATQIKIMAGGGVSSEFDPLHMVQFSLDEMKAIVGVAEDYGTYVLAHAYHDKSVNRAIDAGVRVIEHNFLVSEETIMRMKAEGVALSVQAVVSLVQFGDAESITFFTRDQKNKATRVHEGALQMMKWAVKHDLLMVTGGDMFGPYVFSQADNIIKFNEVVNDPVAVLKTATSNAAEVLSWSGEMNPYKYGTLGTIVEGGYADMILIDGNPLEDITRISREHVDFVMKDGVVYKNNM